MENLDSNNLIQNCKSSSVLVYFYFIKIWNILQFIYMCVFVFFRKEFID